MWISVALGLVEPVSAAMLAVLVVRHRELDAVTWALRAWLAVLAVGLVLHATRQWTLVWDYRPPRTWTWLPYTVSVNALIWLAFFRDRRGLFPRGG